MKTFFEKNSAFQIIYDFLNKRKITLYDIAGLFYNKEDKYKKLNNEIEETIIENGRVYDKENILDFILSVQFHEKFNKFLNKPASREDLLLILELSSKLPININVKHVYYNLLTDNLSHLLFGFNWDKEDIVIKFLLWKFARNINNEIKFSIIMVNLDYIEKKMFDKKEIAPSFINLKEDYELELNPPPKTTTLKNNSSDHGHCPGCC